MFSILMTSLTDTPLILQWEVWLASLLGLKGLIGFDHVDREDNSLFWSHIHGTRRFFMFFFQMW